MQWSTEFEHQVNECHVITLHVLVVLSHPLLHLQKIQHPEHSHGKLPQYIQIPVLKRCFTHLYFVTLWIIPKTKGKTTL